MVKNQFFNNLGDRHVAITDGVFAIAMTILVLEIAVPTISDISSGVALNEYFITYLAPSILIYFISFYIVYNFWENTVFLFKFYNYIDVNIFFSLLILAISLLYILIFILLIRHNFKGYFENKEEIKTSIRDSYEDGVELNNLKLYVRGVTLTLLYLLLLPVISSLISLVLAFVSPLLSVLSFLLMLILRFLICMKRSSRDSLENIELTDDEMELVGNIRQSIYGE